MYIIAKNYYGRTSYAGVFAEVIRETDTRYYVQQPVEGYAKGRRDSLYVDKDEVIVTDATPEMWGAIKKADDDYERECARVNKELREAHKAAIERIIRPS